MTQTGKITPAKAKNTRQSQLHAPQHKKRKSFLIYCIARLIERIFMVAGTALIIWTLLSLLEVQFTSLTYGAVQPCKWNLFSVIVYLGYSL